MNFAKTSTETENIKKEIEIIKKNHSEIKNTVTEMKKTSEGSNDKLDEAEDRMWNMRKQNTPNHNGRKRKRIKNKRG